MVLNSTIKVKFKYNKYENGNGYCIYSYKDMDSKKVITCLGNYLPKYEDVIFEFSGEWKHKEPYGLGFHVHSYKEIIENSLDSIVAYLSCGIIKGIGKKMAERIYAEFGNKSIEILEKEPEKLVRVKGISKKKMELISESYKEHHAYKEVVEFLLPYGVSPKLSAKIVNELKLSTTDAIAKNPYKLCELHTLSISTIDSIAKKLEFPMDSKERLIAHANHVLIQNELDGHTGMSSEDFGTKLIQSLQHKSFHRGNICDYTIQMVKEGVLKYSNSIKNNYNKTIIFRAVSYFVEKKVAENMLNISWEQQPDHKDAVKTVMKNCRAANISLDNDQFQAVLTAINSSFTVITGGPGTGKTTIIKQIANYLSETEDKKIVFMAPTGRAARRIEESTGYPASTIHKALQLRVGEVPAGEEKVTFENTTVIVDEFSMVGAYLSNLLFEAIQPGCRVILVGDEHQLQSVEAGAVLRDIISSGVMTTVRLTHVHRQSDDSMIYLNSQDFLNGNADLKEGSDFHMEYSETSAKAQEKMIQSYLDKVNQYGLENVYCICPCKERNAGVKNMNEILQSAVNPAKSGDSVFKAAGMEFRIGDPVMHLKNSMEASNGDIGMVKSIYDDPENGLTMDALYFGDTTISYTMDNIDEVTLAYAFTVHKAQGSENKIVITYISKEIGYRMLNQNLFHTAITRASSYVEIHLLNDKALEIAAKTDNSLLRITSLDFHLRLIGGQFITIKKAKRA